MPEPAIRAFHITVNSPLPQSAVAWLYAGGVSSILPDMRFGTVSLDQVTYEYNLNKKNDENRAQHNTKQNTIQ